MKGLSKSFEYVPGLAIRGIVTGNVTNSAVPTDMHFLTGSPSLTTRMLITKEGRIGVNNLSPSARLTISEFSNGSNPNVSAFEVQTTLSADIRKFRIGTGNNDPSSLKALLEGELKITHGDIISSDGSVLVEEGNVYIPEGKITVGTSDLSGNYIGIFKGEVLCETLTIADINDWPDWVFSKDYTLRPLSEVEAFVREHGHLPGISSAKELESNGGVNVGEMQKDILQKVEELTLYIIQQQKEIESLKKKLNKLNLD